MNCSYCAYPNHSAKKLTKKDLLAANKNISSLRKMISEKFPDCQIISITGGEPLLYPAILKIFLKQFPDKWIRISTNGILIDKINLKPYNSHGNIYFAVSLDGHTTKMNQARLSSAKLLEKIISNIDYLLSKNYPVEILMTLHRNNIDYFYDFVDYLENKYPGYIKKQKLWLLPSPVVNYLPGNKFSISTKQKLQFIQKYKLYKTKNIIRTVGNYYQKLIDYFADKKDKNHCNMNEWALSIKYLENSIWEDGQFLLYGCGCRGVKILGKMDLKVKFENEEIVQRIKSKILKEYFKNDCYICKNDCFNNWHFYDLQLKHKASKDVALNNIFKKYDRQK